MVALIERRGPREAKIAPGATWSVVGLRGVKMTGKAAWRRNLLRGIAPKKIWQGRGD